MLWSISPVFKNNPPCFHLRRKSLHCTKEIKALHQFYVLLLAPRIRLLSTQLPWQSALGKMTSGLNSSESHFHPLSSSDKTNYMMSFSISKRRQGNLHRSLLPLAYRAMADGLIFLLMVPIWMITNKAGCQNPFSSQVWCLSIQSWCCKAIPEIQKRAGYLFCKLRPDPLLNKICLPGMPKTSLKEFEKNLLRKLLKMLYINY